MVRLFESGLILPKLRKGVVNQSGGATGVSRGKIKKFSYDSRLRLRLALVTKCVPNCRRVGVTLTLPWSADLPDLLDLFREVMHRFRVAWLREFSGCACIFRVELQRRGVPHVHIIAWHTFPFDSSLRDKYFLLWFRAVRDMRGGSMSDFARFGVRLDTVPNVCAALRYLCDHLSKKKQAQLGYRGKQWGILGRANLCDSVGVSLPLSESQFVLLLRVLRRIVRFRVYEKSGERWHKKPCPFGSKLVSRKRLNRVVYCSRDSVFRICRAYGWL